MRWSRDRTDSLSARQKKIGALGQAHALSAALAALGM